MKTVKFVIVLLLLCESVILNSQVFVENSGNVGIGVIPNNDPLTQLHIKSQYENSNSMLGGIRIQALDNKSGFIFRESGSSGYQSLVFRTNGLNTLRIKNYGVGINSVVDDNYALKIGGNVYVSGTITYNSDVTLKKNINSLSETKIKDLYKLDAISYNFDAEKLKIKDYSKDGSELINDTIVNPMDTRRYEKMASKSYIGISAQELKNIYPELVSEDDKGYLSIDYISLIPILIEALKEQKAQIEALRLMIDDKRIK
jgi:hypothetical protein